MFSHAYHEKRIGQILRKVQRPKIQPGEIENVNRPTTNSEIEIDLTTPNKQKSRTRLLHKRILSNN